jgi:hypothetical protein
MEKRQVNIQLAKIYEPLFKKKRMKAMFGGRGGGRSHNVARYILIRAMQEKLRIWCAREIQNSISDSVQHLFVELIQEYGLEEYFKITDTDITSANGSYFMFKGFRGSGGTYSAERLKAYEDFDILWVEEASACSMESLNVVSKTIRKEGSELLFTFNRVLEEDPVWRFTCYDCGDIYNTGYYEDEDRLIIYANVERNEFATSILYKEQEQDKKRLTIDEYNRIWLGYPDRSGGMKSFFPRDIIYRSREWVPEDEVVAMYEPVCGFDPNGGGKDSACAVCRQGPRIVDMRLYRGIKDPLELANAFIEFKLKNGAAMAYCDRGYGQAVIAIARQQGQSIVPVDFGGKSVSNKDCINRRAEIYQKFKEWLQDGGYLGDPKDNEIVELKRELQAVEYNLRKSDDGKIALGPKDDIRKRLGHSPDRADAVALTFAGFKDRLIKDARGRFIEHSDGFAQDGDYAVYTFENIDTTRLL